MESSFSPETLPDLKSNQTDPTEAIMTESTVENDQAQDAKMTELTENSTSDLPPAMNLHPTMNV